VRCTETSNNKYKKAEHLDVELFGSSGSIYLLDCGPTARGQFAVTAVLYDVDKETIQLAAMGENILRLRSVKAACVIVLGVVLMAFRA
jgi:hypothetical protein